MNEYSNLVNDIYKDIITDPSMPMTLRIGVAGHRSLPENPEQLQWIKSQLKALYQNIYSFTSCLSASPEATMLYRKGCGPVIRFTSSLAEGADRLCIAKELIDFDDYQLAFILPFSKEEYAKDFAPTRSIVDASHGTIDEFDEVLSRGNYGSSECRVLELDGHPEKRDDAYRRCGSVLVDHSDILIAVYNGINDSQEGTSGTVNAAISNGVPVIHISTTDQTTSIFTSGKFGRLVTKSDFSQTRLESELSRLLLFDDVFSGQDKADSASVEARREIVSERFERYGDSSKLRYNESVIDFDNSGPIELDPQNIGILSSFFGRFKEFLAPKKSNDNDEVSVDTKIENPSTHNFYAAYLRADRLANYYSDLHRSTFLSIFFLGTAALILAVLSLWKGIPPSILTALVSVKLVFLACIYWLYWRDHKYDYHGRWLEYRFLSESLRPMFYLIGLGKTYSLVNLRDTKEYLGRDIIGHNGVGRAWLYIYSEILIRHVGFNYCVLSQSEIIQVSEFAAKTWINGQLKYHQKNTLRMKRIGERLANWSLYLFYATVIVVLLKLVKIAFSIHLDLIDVSTILGVLAAVFPILATASFVVSNHAEFDISSQRSLTMGSYLSMQAQRLRENPGSLSSQQLSDQLHEVASMTTKEVADWLEIYEVKEAEPA
ncbi:Uncharacterised protein [Halioglobus japonicus]|nr:Uncharacterised protein [Halioglobus japonicus]